MLSEVSEPVHGGSFGGKFAGCKRGEKEVVSEFETGAVGMVALRLFGAAGSGAILSD
jgi:hypothetical protein